ncbi:MAG: DUF3307 domain-containing protein [Candidatus Promineifilaceae bacterium]|jgi:hypothetical protein
MSSNLTSMFPITTAVLIWAVIIHLVVDWFLQTEWMAVNKTNLKHPAAYVHSGLHTLGMLLIFPWWLAIGLGISHLLIDTRKPVIWWIETIKQMPPSAPVYSQVEMWLDQIFHLLMLFIAVLVLPALIS